MIKYSPDSTKYIDYVIIYSYLYRKVKKIYICAKEDKGFFHTNIQTGFKFE